MDHPLGYEYNISGEKKDLLSTRLRRGRMSLWEATARLDDRGCYGDSQDMKALRSAVISKLSCSLRQFTMLL